MTAHGKEIPLPQCFHSRCAHSYEVEVNFTKLSGDLTSRAEKRDELKSADLALTCVCSYSCIQSV